ncbi:LolA-related protein [Minwuia sp.]|uniref:LolA-related protein n=1 Tax=Minwuia sp. TaxID=2493630 RepID=UPI003A8DC892
MLDEAPRSFSQKRHLPDLPNPLRSSGMMQADKERFVWQVCQPFDIRTVVAADGITQSVEGEEPQPLGPEMVQEVIRQISISDIFRGDFDQLQSAFRLSRREGASGEPWKVTMTPRAARLADIIAEIDVSGCQVVEQVSIRYLSGGRDEILVVGKVAPSGPAACPTN